MHIGKTSAHGPIATVRFVNLREAAAAFRIMLTANLPFFASSGGETQSAQIQIEPYRPPVLWQDELWAESDALFSSDEAPMLVAKQAKVPITMLTSVSYQFNSITGRLLDRIQPMLISIQRIPIMSLRM